MVAKLYSKLDHAVQLRYGNSSIRVPAHAFELPIYQEWKLQELPVGITMIIEPKKQEIKQEVKKDKPKKKGAK